MDTGDFEVCNTRQSTTHTPASLSLVDGNGMELAALSLSGYLLSNLQIPKENVSSFLIQNDLYTLYYSCMIGRCTLCLLYKTMANVRSSWWVEFNQFLAHFIGQKYNVTTFCGSVYCLQNTSKLHLTNQIASSSTALVTKSSYGDFDIEQLTNDQTYVLGYMISCER